MRKSSRLSMFYSPVLCGPLRISAVFGGNGYFTAESQRYAEGRRENLLKKRRICVLATQRPFVGLKTGLTTACHTPQRSSLFFRLRPLRLW
jgi:hypothetical protein